VWQENEFKSILELWTRLTLTTLVTENEVIDWVLTKLLKPLLDSTEATDT
jgi:trans-aconitate methyltransferase